MGIASKFLFWCFGYSCQGGGDCMLQDNRYDCIAHLGEAQCGDKIGEDSQGACDTIHKSDDRYKDLNEFQIKEKCESHM